MMKKSDLPKSSTLSESLARAKTMGPSPLKLCEELLDGTSPRPVTLTCDLGSGTSITSALLARECGLDVYAVDLWSDPAENRVFFREPGIDNATTHPIKADASQGLPVARKFFECVASIDSYSYYERDPRYPDEYLLPYVSAVACSTCRFLAWYATATVTCRIARLHRGRSNSSSTCMTSPGGAR